MIGKPWMIFSHYVIFENFTDTRQTKFGNIYTRIISNPVFKDFFAPLDKVVINARIKIKI